MRRHAADGFNRGIHSTARTGVITMRKPLVLNLGLVLSLLLLIVYITKDEQVHRGNDGGAAGIADEAPHLLEEDRRSLELDRRIAIMREVCNQNSEIAKQLIDGRVTLKEAARRYHRLNLEAGLVAHVEELPGSTTGERTCRQVIYHVSGHPDHLDDAARAVILARLEAELAELLEDGSVSRILDMD
jgi:hypothetical protein